MRHRPLRATIPYGICMLVSVINQCLALSDDSADLTTGGAPIETLAFHLDSRAAATLKTPQLVLAPTQQPTQVSISNNISD